MGEIHQIFITELCNQNCMFCSYDRENVNRKQIPLEKVYSTIESIPDNPEEIILDGGEPTIRKELFHIAGVARRKNPKKLTLCTNGMMLSYPGFTDKLKDSGITFVLVSLHSHIEEVSDSITRVKGGFQKTVIGIKSLKNSGIETGLSFVINKLNYMDIIAYLKFVQKEFGKMHITYSFVMPAGNAIHNSHLVPKITDVQPYLLEALQYCEEEDISFSFTGCSIPPCFLPGFERHTGEFLLSDSKFMMTREGEERVRFIADGKIKPDECASCRFDSVCGGVWEGYARIFGFAEITDARRKLQFQEDLKLFNDTSENLTFFNSSDMIYDSFLRRRIGVISEYDIISSWMGYIKDHPESQYDLYFHVPFCRSACKYCIYPSTQYDPSYVKPYLEYIRTEINKYKNVFKGVVFKALYIGGGSPSLLKDEELESFLKMIFHGFTFHPEGEKAIEFNPGSTTEGKAGIVSSFGFNRISMGVQSCDKIVLDINNRGYQDINESMDILRRHGIRNISTDLILGLKGDDSNKLIESFKTLAGLGPDTIFLYPIKATEDYVLKNFGSKQEFDRFYLDLHSEVSRSLPEIANSLGYIASSNIGFIHPTCFLKKGIRQDFRFFYRHHYHTQHAVMGFGFYSNPIIPYRLDYRLVEKGRETGIYLKEFSLDPKDYVYFAEGYSEDFQKIRHIVNSVMKERKIDKSLYMELFSSDIYDDYSYALDALNHFGIAKIKDDSVEFCDLEENEMIKYLLFFTGRDKVRRREE